VVDYRARRKSYAFHAGIERVLNELQHASCTLMCAEEDPLECHRFLMICPELVRLGIRPLHIRKGSKIESQEDAENRLLSAHGLGGFAGGHPVSAVANRCSGGCLRLAGRQVCLPC
jgi:uncharacterized protein (DUF488 family)